ncbi:MAG: hypothetical protein K0R34_3106 [Herbinix sp.]|nr:hypothetical protein [Herbinix sp.]
MEILELMTSQGNIVMVRIKIITYTDNGCIYIGLVSVDGELEEPFADVTVNLGGDAIEYCGYLDTGNLPELEAFITENGIGEHTGFTKKSGYNEYPFYVFNARRLQALCPQGVAQYEQILRREQQVYERQRSR